MTAHSHAENMSLYAEDAADLTLLHVPLGRGQETDLMAALEFVIQNYKTAPVYVMDANEVRRATDWLHTKYGTQPNSQE